jgi:hypothetical protein
MPDPQSDSLQARKGQRLAFNNSSDADEPSTCPVCKQAAESFKSDGLWANRLHRWLTLGDAAGFEHRVSCATCQSIWHMLKDRTCPKGKKDSKVEDKATAFCDSCIVRLQYSKAVPQGYGHYLVLEVSFFLPKTTF